MNYGIITKTGRHDITTNRAKKILTEIREYCISRIKCRGE